MALPFRFFVGGRLGSGRQWMSWVTLEDEVGAIRFLIDRDDIAGPVNVVAPEPVTNAEHGRGPRARRCTARRAVPVPPFAPRLALGREMADSLLFASQRVHAGGADRGGLRLRPPRRRRRPRRGARRGA